MIELRRLDPELDESLIREAVGWLDEQPQFYKDADCTWGEMEGAEQYLKLMRSEPQADFGVFEDERLVAIVTVTLESKGIFNSHLMVKRGTNPLTVIQAAASVMRQLFENGMREGWSWLARKNYGARRIVEAIGMKRNGVSRFKGRSHGQPIEWLMYSVRAN